MVTSVFDLFKIGIGPSSSHTIGPMWAANRFLLALEDCGAIERVARLDVRLYGSLALTGRGHGTDKAVILGLLGETPDQIDPDLVVPLLATVRESQTLVLFGRKVIPYVEDENLIFCFDKVLPEHPNGMEFVAKDAQGDLLCKKTYYSVGGGFVVGEGDVTDAHRTNGSTAHAPYRYGSAADVLAIGRETGLTIAEIVLENEKTWHSVSEIHHSIDEIWSAMNACIERGCRQVGTLPGGLHVERRANKIFQALSETAELGSEDPLTILDWVNLFALAVNEENAAGGRVVTAPTNGAAGVIPAVIAYYDRFVPGSDPEGIRTFLLTATAIGNLFKANASISAAEVGCQGEVGVACSMAAAGLTAVLGGTNEQIENAAEIGMEHNLGLTCDPIGGLVQIPCIERNTMGAVKAINSARLALQGDGKHKVGLDQVIETMRQTGRDMQDKYKETATGGLAVNAVNC